MFISLTPQSFVKCNAIEEKNKIFISVAAMIRRKRIQNWSARSSREQFQSQAKAFADDGLSITVKLN